MSSGCIGRRGKTNKNVLLFSDSREAQDQVQSEQPQKMYKMLVYICDFLWIFSEYYVKMIL